MNKHPDDYVFGLDKDIQNKLKLKFDQGKQDQAQAWIEEVTGVKFTDDFQPFLKSGITLCNLINIIKPKSVRKINKMKAPFMQRENIVNYLEACKAIGLKDSDCFVTQDLFEGSNLVVVIDQIFSLGAISRNVDGFEGPYLGVKFSDENKREFTQEQINKGKQFVPLQSAGSIKVEKSKGTDAIVMYGKVGQEMGNSSSEVSQQSMGSIQVDKGKGTDHIVRYGKVGQEMGKSSGGVSQQNSGSIQVDKGKGTDAIVKYGKVGQEMGKSSSEVSQQNSGSIEVEKQKKLDSVTRVHN